MKKIYLLILILVAVSGVQAQTEFAAFNLTGCGYTTAAATDYQCLGINPANLGWTWNDRRVNLSFLESAFSLYSEPLTKKQVTHDLFNSNFEMTPAEQQQAVMSFSDKRIVGDFSVQWVGASYQNEKIGGIAISVREHLTWSTLLNTYGSRFLFLGYHDPYFDSLVVNGKDTVGYSTLPRKASDILSGTTQNFLWTRDYTIGYGRIILNKENVKVYAGVDFTYTTAYAGVQYHDPESDGTMGFSALSPYFKINYNTPTPSAISGDGLKKVGWGWGLDIGATVQLYNKLKISLAVNNIGQLKFNGNVYQGHDTYLWEMKSGGITNYNIFQQGQLIRSEGQGGDSSLWYGVKEKTFSNPMDMRVGAAWRIVKQVEVGADLLIPMNKDVPGVYEKMLLGFGARYNPAKWVEISAGITSGNKTGTHMPVGITFYPLCGGAWWQVGLATRDFLTLFKQNNPMVSAAFGFMRFSFGGKS
jgi:hypothetical protein